MRILITGTRGFIGKNLLESLKKEHAVIGYDILDGYQRPKTLNISQYDWVFHIGAASSTTATDINQVIDLNLSWSIELFEECINYGVNFQWSSSASVYGRVDKGLFTEDRKPNPLNLYARSKFLLEEYIKNRQAPIQWQGFRYFNVYGPGEEHKGKQASPYYQFAHQASTYGIIKIFENSSMFFRDFVHVDRVCEVHSQMLNSRESGIWNLGTGNPDSFENIAKKISDEYKANIEYIPMPCELQEHYQSYTCADMTKLENTLKNI